MKLKSHRNDYTYIRIMTAPARDHIYPNKSIFRFVPIRDVPFTKMKDGSYR